MKILRAILSAVAVVALSFAGLAATAAPASAAGGICQTKFSGLIYLPTEEALGSYSCYMYKTYGGRAAVDAFQETYNTCYAGWPGRGASWPSLIEDGIYGDDTAAAVERVQRYHGLKDDGYYGPATAAKLIYYSAPSQCVTRN
jgi:hypothetical protein